MNKLIGKMTVLFAAAVAMLAVHGAKGQITWTQGEWSYQSCWLGGIMLTAYTGEGGHIDIPDAIEHEEGVWVPVTSLGPYLFDGREDVTSVTMPSGLLELREAVFRGTGLTEAVLPDTVTQMGWTNTFECEGFERLEVGSDLLGAIYSLPDGARLEVRPGRYKPIRTDNRPIRIVALEGPSKTIIDAGGTNECCAILVDSSQEYQMVVTNVTTWGTNSFTNTYTVGSQTNTILEGFTLTGSERPYRFGGSAVIGGTLVGCVLEYNRSYLDKAGGLSYGNAFGCRFYWNESERGSGGGMYRGLVAEDCEFLFNTASGSVLGEVGGGGAAREVVFVRHCQARENRAESGGGFLQCGEIEDCFVYGNTATNGGGGGLYDCAFVKNSRIRENSAAGHGGGLYGNAGGAVASNCVVFGNTAHVSSGTIYGGGIYQFSHLQDCEVAYNVAETEFGDAQGGGIHGGQTASRCLVRHNRLIGKSKKAYGGGVYGIGSLTDCMVEDNVASGSSVYGGGVANVQTATNCNITGNVASNSGSIARGGGVYGGAWSNCRITNNSAKEGGGAADITAIDCEISGNQAGTGGGAIETLLTGCVVSNNTASSRGGGVYGGSGASGCTIVYNQAFYGGGAYNESLTNCVVEHNRAGADAGGVYYGTLNSCLVRHNQSGGDGGGGFGATLNSCTVEHNRAEANGGGVYHGTLNNCFVGHNQAGKQGGGAYSATLSNCIVVHNQAAQNGGCYSTSGRNYTVALNESTYGNPSAPEWGKNNVLIWGEKVGEKLQLPQTKQVGMVTNGTEWTPGAVEVGVKTNEVLREAHLPLEVAFDAEGNPWWPDSPCCDWSDLLETGETDLGGVPLNDYPGDLWVVRTGGILITIRHDDTEGLQSGWILSDYISFAGGTCNLDDMTNGLEFVSQTFSIKYWDTETETIYGTPVYAPTPCPMVDPWNGDYRLVAGCEAIDAGYETSLATDFAGNPRVQGEATDYGALEAEGGVGVDVGWRRIAVLTEGSGKTDAEIVSTEAGGSVTLTALDWGRPFLGWKIDGEIVSTNRIFTWENVTEHGVATAVFGNGDIWVDAATGDDANDGNEGTPLKTLQAATMMACDGDTVRVRPGTYDSFTVMWKDIDIIGVSGAEETIIDAKWQGRCATLDSVEAGESKTRMKGFTLRHGSGSDAAVYKGSLEDCIIEDCGTGGENEIFYETAMTRCIVRGCRAARLYRSWSNSRTNRDTLVTGNQVQYLWSSYGDNVNLTIAGNDASEKVIEGGAWHNCIVWGNGTTNASGWSGGWNCIEGAEPQAATEDEGPIWTDNPEFVDAEYGDWRLSSTSPYVNAGNNEWADSTVDLTGNPRIAAAAVDLGCLEGSVVVCSIRFELGNSLFQLDETRLELVAGLGDTVHAPEVIALSGWRFDGWDQGLTVTGDAVICGITTAVPSDWPSEIHRGRVDENTTWGAGMVHVVDGTVTVADGAFLTIAEGTVVKFAPGAVLEREDGGCVVSEGAVFTHLFDDEVGGDTLGDGMARLPVPGEYSVQVDEEGTGTRYRYTASCTVWFVLEDGLVQLDHQPLQVVVVPGASVIPPEAAAVSGWRFDGWQSGLTVVEDTVIRGETSVVPSDWTTEIHRGRVETNTMWRAGTVHVLEGTVTVAPGATLTIEAGAVVKFAPGATLVGEDGGRVVSLGAVFTHLFDDDVGGDTLEDGAWRVPVSGEYMAQLDVEEEGTEWRYGGVQEERTPDEDASEDNPRLITWGPGTVHVLPEGFIVKDYYTLRLAAGTIVKVGDNQVLAVQPNGTLIVEGTLSKPVIITSMHDDARGGDTDDDGGLRLPSGGDWKYIYIQGCGRFNHCSIRYTSNTSNFGGMEVCGGTVEFDNSEIAHCMYECVNAHAGGRFTARNSAFWDASLGFGYYGMTNVQAYNCVFHGLTTAIRQMNKQLVNCVFNECLSFTDQGGDLSQFDHCLFWNPEGYGVQNYVKVGQNGNIWGNPKFVGAEDGIFQIQEGSACIDAGNGMAAPERDMFGNSRVTLTDEAATGVAGADGTMADIGLHEYVGRYGAGMDVDVRPTEVRILSGGEGVVRRGDTLNLSWRLESIGEGAYAGTWKDRLKMLNDGGMEIVLGERENTGRLEPGTSKPFASTFAVPFSMDGEWLLGVEANINRGVLEGGNTENNGFVSTNVLTVENPTVAADGGTLNLRAGETKLMRLTGTLEEGDALWVTATAGMGPVRAWGLNGAVPGEERHWTCTGTSGGGALVAVGAVHDAEKTYLLLKNEGGDELWLVLSRDAGGAEMVVTGLEREEVTAGAMVPVALEGVGLAGATALELWKDGELVATGTGLMATPGKVSGVFDLRGALAGEYEVKATDGAGRTATAPVPLRLVVVPTATGRLVFGLTLPESVRDGRMYEGRVWYRNVGNADMAAPVFEVFTKKGSATVARTANGPFRRSGCILTGRGAGNPAVILRAGESGVAKFHFLSMGKYTLAVRWMKEGGAAQPEAWLERWAAEQARQEAAAEESAERQAEWETTGRQRIADYLAGFSTQTVETEKGSVTGRLEDAATGMAVTGAVVRLESAGAAVKEETTGADGGFAFEGIWPLGTYAVTAEGWALDAESAKVSVTGAVEVATLEATRLTRVTGTVTAGGEGVPEVAVWATDAEGWRADCTSGEGGAYDLGWLADGEWVLGTAGTAGYAGARETVTVAGQGGLEVALAMGPGVRWEGRVVDAANGAGVPDVELGVCDETGEIRFWATSGDGGAFAFPAVPTGTLQVGSLSAEWQAGDGVAEITPVPMGAGTVTGDVTVARAPLVRAFPDEGAAPLAVQFGLTAAGETVGAVAWSWDFDGDGVEDSDEEAPVWEYATSGTNAPSVTLTREDGTSVTATLTVAVRDRLPTLYHDGVIVLLDGDAAQSEDWAFAGWDEDTGTLRVRQVSTTPSVALAAGTKFVFAADEDGTLGLKAATGVAGPDGEGVWTVETEDAGLTAIYEQLDWSASTVVAGGGGASPSAKGGRRDGGNVAEGSFGDTFHETWSSGSTHVDWKASYNGNLYANIAVQNGVAVTRGRGEITITETTTLRAGGKAESSFGVHHELINKTFRTGGIPIHVQGDAFVDLKMLLMLQGSHEHTAKVTQSFTYDGSGLHESHSFHYDPKISRMQLRESASGNSGLKVSALAQTPYGPLGFAGRVGFQGEQQFTRSGSSGHWLSTGNPYIAGEFQVPLDGIKQSGKNFLASIASACSVNDVLGTTMARFAEGQLMDLYSDKIMAEVIQELAPHLTLEEFKDGLAAAARQELGELAGLDRFSGLGVDAILNPEIARQIIPGYPTGEAWVSMQSGLIPNVMEVVLNPNAKQTAFQEAYRRFVSANYAEEATKAILAAGAAEAAADSGGMNMHVWLGTPADMESGSGVKIVNNTVQHAVVDYGNGRTDSLGSGENTLNGNYSKAGYYLGEIQVERSALSLPPAWFVVRVQDLDESNEKFPTAAKAVVSVLADLYEVNGPRLGSVDAWNQFNGDQVPMALKVLGGLNPLLWDSSGEEKIDDHWKLLMGTSPVYTRANDDPDGDDLTNWQEYQGEGPDEEEEPEPSPESRRAGKRGSSPNRAAKNATHPLRPDTDEGGQSDGVELIWGSNPNYRWDDDKVCTGCLHQNEGSGQCVCTELYGVEQCTCGGCPECMPEDDEDEDPVQSCDPNEIVGPLGVGDPETERYVERGEELEYTIYFENKADAVAAAQEIRVEMQLDPQLDWSTFEAGSVVVGATWDDGLAGKANWTSEVAMAEGTFRVRSEVRCDAGTGKVEWYVRAVDPESAPLLWPKDPYAGILPPNDEETHCGEGRVTFRAKVREDAAEGAVVGATATITFDYNEPIETNPSWWNKVAAVLYEVTFVDDDGLILKQATKYTNGTVAADIVLPATPSKMTGARCRYMFAGWSPVLADVTEDATYLATYQLLGMASANGVLLPAAWLEANCPGALGENGAAALEGTVANGRDTVWQCYVAGLDPNDPGAVYECAAELEMGDPDETGAAEVREVVLRVLVPAGRVAEVKSAAALTAPVIWTDTTAFTNTTDEAKTETYNADVTDGGIRFYRVLLRLAE